MPSSQQVSLWRNTAVWKHHSNRILAEFQQSSHYLFTALSKRWPVPTVPTGMNCKSVRYSVKCAHGTVAVSRCAL